MSSPTIKYRNFQCPHCSYLLSPKTETKSICMHKGKELKGRTAVPCPNYDPNPLFVEDIIDNSKCGFIHIENK